MLSKRVRNKTMVNLFINNINIHKYNEDRMAI